MSSDWIRVNRAKPCRICDHDSWCTISADGAVACCMRVADGAFKHEDVGHGEAHYHRLIDNRDQRREAPKREPAEISAELEARVLAQLRQLDRRARAGMTDERWNAITAELGLSRRSLERCGVGFAGYDALAEFFTAVRGPSGKPYKGGNCWAHPMTSPIGGKWQIGCMRLCECGGGFKFSTDRPDGSRYSDAGGLFVPADLDARGGLLGIVEGRSDTPAMLDMGVEAVGRPSCTGGLEYLRLIVAEQQPAEVVIIHDRDEPDGAAVQLLADVTSAYDLLPVNTETHMATAQALLDRSQAWLQGREDDAGVDDVREAAKHLKSRKTAWDATYGGAVKLADALRSSRRSVCHIMPPVGIKDAREWLHAGATVDDVQAAMEQAQPVKAGRYDWMRSKEQKR